MIVFLLFEAYCTAPDIVSIDSLSIDIERDRTGILRRHTQVIFVFDPIDLGANFWCILPLSYSIVVIRQYAKV